VIIPIPVAIVVLVVVVAPYILWVFRTRRQASMDRLPDLHQLHPTLLMPYERP
jgi:hypothetical protein